MARRIVPVKKPKPIPVMICRNREEVTLALKKARECRGLTQSDLDEKAGFHLGYTGKLEQPFPRAWPSGRCPLHPMFDLWLKALGVAVIVIPDTHSVDERTIGEAVPPSDNRPPRMTLKRANRIRLLHREGWKIRLLAKHFHTTNRLIEDIVEGRAFMPPAGANENQITS